MAGATSLLNEWGEWTLAWTDENDEKAIPMILSMMERGVTFWIIDPRGLRKKITPTTVDKATTHRHVAFSDEYVGNFLESGSGQLVSTGDAPIKTKRRPKGKTKEEKAADVASNESVGIRQRGGG